MGERITIQCEDETLTHMTGGVGDYASLCGLDGDDPHPAVQQRTTPTPKGAKINCPHCISIWLDTKKYPKWQIDPELLHELQE